METIRLRKKHDSTIMKDVIVCCQHSDKFFIDTNGLLTHKTCHFFCQNTCNNFTQVYTFTCTRCLKSLQQGLVSLYDLNFGWNKHYIDKRDIRQVILNGFFRFCTLLELKSKYSFCIRHFQINNHG